MSGYKFTYDRDALQARADAIAASERREDERRRAWRAANGLPPETDSDRQRVEFERNMCPYS